MTIGPKLNNIKKVKRDFIWFKVPNKNRPVFNHSIS